MTFRGSIVDIRLFVAAYEERSFTGAAQRENTSQSGVSHHIKQIEQQLKVTLFVRQPSGVTATPAAEKFYRECHILLRGLDRAAADMENFGKGMEGQFTVALSPALALRAVAPALLRFNAVHPNVRVRIVEATPDQMPQMIRTHQVDIAISSVHEGGPALRVRQLLTAPECLVTQAAGNRSSAMIENVPVNLVLPVLKERRRAAIIDSLHAQKISVGTVVEIDSALTILDLVSRSNWVTVSPSLIVDPKTDERLELRPLWQSGLIYRAILLEPASNILPAGAAEFIDILTEEASQIVEEWNRRFERLDKW